MSDENLEFNPKLLPILTYPDERLRVVAEKVTEFDDELQQLVIDMIATMSTNNGIGLAAPQVGIAKRIITILLDDTPLALINPIIVASKGEIISEEGCLSIPGYFDKVKRYEEIVVSYQTTHGEQKESTAGGILSTVVQHEIDHLNGKLFVDYLSTLKQNRAKEKSKKTAKKLKRLMTQEQ